MNEHYVGVTKKFLQFMNLLKIKAAYSIIKISIDCGKRQNMRPKNIAISCRKGS